MREVAPIADPLKILILTDGKMGDVVQCRGVAASVASRLETGALSEALETSTRSVTSGAQRLVRIEERAISQTLLTRIPSASVPVPKADDFLFEQPLPDIVIASGRRVMPHLRKFKRVGKENAPFIAFLKDPRIGYQNLDFVWMPAHDIAVPPVSHFKTLLAPHSLTSDALREAKNSGGTRFAFDWKASRCVSVILGGNSKTVRWTSDMIDRFCKALSDLPSESGFLVTASRRTPPELLRAIENALSDREHWVWDGKGDNPYVEMLAVADSVVVTGDSHNMVSEAVSSGAHILVFRPERLASKLVGFLDKVQEKGYVTDLEGSLTVRSSEAHNQTAEIGDQIVHHFSEWAK